MSPDSLDSARHQFRPTAYQRWGKRTLDLCFCIPALLLFSPILFACALAVRLDSKGPIFFRHRRVGRYGATIQVLKFRSMFHEPSRKASNLTVSGDPRITRVGKYLRRSKLDELPQLFNVLQGQMTLVGPRPEVAEYVSLYTNDQSKVLDLKPGITGAASLAFSNEEAELSIQPSPHEYYVQVLMPRKIELDLSYGQKMSLKADLHCISATVAKIFGSAHWSAKQFGSRAAAQDELSRSESSS